MGPATSEESLDSDGATGKQHRIGGGEIWQMADEMLVAQSKWLPQYKSEVPRAKKRLASEKRLGTRKTTGAARVQTKTTAQMRRDRAAARKNADAADKGGMMRAKANTA